MPHVVNAERLAQVVAGLNGASLLAIQGSTHDGVTGNQRSSALVMHLFGAPAPLANVAVLVTGTAVTVTAEAGPAAFGAAAGTTVPVNVVDTAGFTAAVEAVATVAVTKGEPTTAVQKGSWAAALIAALQAKIDAAADMNPVVAPILAVGDTTTTQSLAKAGAVVTASFKRFGLEYVQKELSKREPVSQADASQAFTDVVNAPDTMPGLEEMDPAGFESAIPANVQSGPDFDLKMVNPAQSANELCGPVVCVSVASKFNGVVAHGARTLFVQPVAPSVTEAYTFMLELHEKIRSLLTIGKALKDVHSEALAYAQMRNATLAAKLGQENFGFSTGMHFMDRSGTIGPKATLSVCPGSMLTLRLIMKDVEIPAAEAAAKPEVKEEDAVADAPAEATTKVSLVLSDTVLCTTEGGTNDKCIVTKAKRGLDDVSFTVKKRKPKAEVEEVVYEKRATRGATATIGLGQEEARNEKQKELFNAKRAAWIAAGSPAGVEAGNTTRPEDNTANGRLARGALFSYPEGVIPQEFASKPNEIQVDRRNHTLLLPIGGEQLAFHISTIAKVDARPDTNNHTAFTVTFGTTQQSNIAFARHRNRQWLREVTYRRAEGGPLYQAMSNIKDVQATLKTLDSQKKQDAHLASSIKLKMRANAPRLPAVKLRPAPSASTRGVGAAKGGLTGNVDAHDNGLRFSAAGFTLDIPYENIKHFICQPSRKDVVVLIHCALKAPMKIGDKPHSHVQFYTEVLESSEAASGMRKSHEEELAQEERDRQRIKETNAQFAQFAGRVKDISGMPVEAPFKEADFEGAGNKRMSRFRGNQRAIWALSELPFSVISVEDIEVVSLERVLPGQSTFDAVFIHKDYRETTMVSTISMTKLEVVKDLLGEAGLIYFEGANNVAWNKLLKVMRDDNDWEAWGTEGWIQYIDPHHDDEEGGEDSDTDPDDAAWESEEETDEDSSDEASDSDWASEGSSSEVDASDDSDVSIAGSDDDDDDDLSDSEDSRKRGRGGKSKLPAQRRPAQPGRR